MSEECIVHNLLINGDGTATPLALDETPAADLALLHWSHIDYSRPGAYEWLLAQGVDHTIAEALTSPESRPRVDTHGNGLLLMLRAVNLNPGARPDDMVSIRVWLQPHRIITVRQRRVMSIQDIVAALAAGDGPHNQGEFILSLIERLAERIGEAVDEIEATIEESELETKYHPKSLQHTASSLRRQTAAMRRFLAPQRDALNTLYRMTNSNLNEQQLHHLREQIDRITRYVEDLDLARERTLVLQEDIRYELANVQNARAYLLSVVAAIFLPLSFLTGVFGMNVAGLPGTENPNGFLDVTAGMGVVAVGLLIYLRYSKWL